MKGNFFCTPCINILKLDTQRKINGQKINKINFWNYCHLKVLDMITNKINNIFMFIDFIECKCVNWNEIYHIPLVKVLFPSWQRTRLKNETKRLSISAVEINVMLTGPNSYLKIFWRVNENCLSTMNNNCSEKINSLFINSGGSCTNLR